MKVMVTGGAGYIGSHAVKALSEAGHDVTVVDNLYRGHRGAVPDSVRFEQLDLLDTDALVRVMKEAGTECVMHFAALAYVGESVDHPMTYYLNNTMGSLSLVSAMQMVGVKRLVFSSTCASYGDVKTLPIVETLPQDPINPYGRSKLFVEHIIKDHAATDSEFSFALLRYFNVAGSADDGSIGEDHTPESHLIPLCIQAALGRRDALTVFGTDYPTPDGTCIRDYVHVEDLVDAHIAVMGALQPGDARIYNLGTGNGFSVKQIIETTEKVMGKKVPVVYGERRPGDPPTLYADPSKIANEIGWKAKHTTPDSMIASAVKWFEARPEGYGDS